MKYYGAAYYPEQETREDIARDVALMKEAGFNAVRVGEFAWCKFEPEDGQFDFGWLDEAVDRLGAGGIASIVCTPTACPPVWMATRHPEILYRDNRGVVRPFGGRRHYCYNHPVYRDYCRRIAAEIGRHYGANPHVLGFHIDNELAQEGTGRCGCDVCRAKFRAWLRAKYGTIAEFNRRAGTIFWGQTYQQFDQIHPPLRTIENEATQAIESFMDNPTLRLDWERFCSDSLIAFQNVQAKALREHAAQPVTTNATGYWTNGLDYYKGFETLDVVAGDIYPSLRTDEMYGASADFAFHRGIKRKNFWVVETSSGGGQGVWARQGTLQPFPGSLRQNAIHTFASSADVVTYFQWRTFRFGAEQLEAAVMDIDGIPRRRFREFQEAARDLRTLTPLLEGTELRNEAAVCYDYDCHWAIRIKPFRHGYTYQAHVLQVTSALAAAGIGCDVIPCGPAIRNYKLIVLVAPVILSEAFKAMLKDYVRDGGTVVATFLTAIKDGDNTAPRQSVPGGLTDLFGLRVGEGEPVLTDTGNDTRARIAIDLGGNASHGRNHTWTESLELQGAEAIGRYEDTFRSGETVAARNSYGKGLAYYLGTGLEDDVLGHVLGAAAAAGGVTPAPFRFGRGVEAIRRQRIKGGKDVYFLFNYRREAAPVELHGAFLDLLNHRTLEGPIVMAPKQYLVLEPHRPSHGKGNAP